MAKFVPWWEALATTPESVAEAARKAGVLVESGDYAVGSLDFGDGGPPVPITTSGAVVAAPGTTWLVYPASLQAEGWKARAVDHSTGTIRMGSEAPKKLGTASDDAEHLLCLLLTVSTADDLDRKECRSRVGEQV